MRSRRLPTPATALLVALVLAAPVLAGCGISTDTTPRDITADGGAAGIDAAGADTEAPTGTGRVYLVQTDAAGAPTHLVPVSRAIEARSDRDPTAVLGVLVAGPDTSERADDISTYVPNDLEQLGWSSRQRGVIGVDLGPQLADLSGTALTFALAQIVYSLSEIPGVSAVRITVEGASDAWPDANGRPQSDPLTVFDYPGFVRSSQPAFPALPSDRPEVP
jgi:spore germination protein GerM